MSRDFDDFRRKSLAFSTLRLFFQVPKNSKKISKSVSQPLLTSFSQPPESKSTEIDIDLNAETCEKICLICIFVRFCRVTRLEGRTDFFVKSQICQNNQFRQMTSSSNSQHLVEKATGKFVYFFKFCIFHTLFFMKSLEILLVGGVHKIFYLMQQTLMNTNSHSSHFSHVKFFRIRRRGDFFSEK